MEKAALGNYKVKRGFGLPLTILPFSPGIVAIDGDWTVDDTVWFTRRVVNNAFVSVVKDVSYDKIDDSLRIGVSLIDTNDPAKDVFIEKELVDSERAAYLCI